MKDSSKVIIAGVIGVIFTASLAIVITPYWLPPLQQFTDRIWNPEPEPIPESESTITEPETEPEPSAPPITTSKNITISYVGTESEHLIWISHGLSGIEMPSTDKLFLVMNITISNNGYESFSTSPFRFYVIADNVKYDFDSNTYLLDDWETVDILDGGTFHGTLVFQVPESTSSYILGYEVYFTRYDIVWNKM